MSRVFNFSAGPAMVPEAVLQQAKEGRQKRYIDTRIGTMLSRSFPALSYHAGLFISSSLSSVKDVCRNFSMLESVTRARTVNRLANMVG